MRHPTTTTDKMIAEIANGDLPLCKVKDAVLADLICVLEARQRDAETRPENIITLLAAMVKSHCSPIETGQWHERGDPFHAVEWLVTMLEDDVAGAVVDAVIAENETRPRRGPPPRRRRV